MHKTLAPGLHDYLCSRILSLPEADVEKYLSQLCQLAVSRPGTSIESVLAQLCARSLRIAVKTYWLLLAISQDNPRNDHVANLRDRCEQAALGGHWELPFKHSRLPSPRTRASSSLPHQTTSLSISQSPLGSGGLNPRGIFIDDPSSRLIDYRNGAFSPEVPPRPLSPDGLGRGIFSSVFMDTGVEGLIQDQEGGADSPNSEIYWYEASQSEPRRGQKPSGGGSVSTTPEGSSLQRPVRALIQEDEKTLLLEGSTARHAANGTDSNVSSLTLTSPRSQPSSPRRRRETTCGATLDFIEALCTASSNLTAFEPADRQWALHRALHSINVELDRASSVGMTIWWPTGRSLRQRVVRLAHKESVLLNSREKAPFTLYVEVLDEVAAEAEFAAEEESARAAALRKTPLIASSARATNPQPILEEPPLPQHMDFDSAAAAAAAAGLPWVAHHHRRSSSHDLMSPALTAAVVAAVQGSSAGGALAPAGAARPPPTPALTPEIAHKAPSLSSARDVTALRPPGSAASLISQRSDASTFATDLSLADFASEASHSPPTKRPASGSSASASTPPSGGVDGFNQSQLPQLSAPAARLSIQGGGTWIGGSSRLHSGTPPQPSHADVTADLRAAMASLRGEAPLVTVRLQIVNDEALYDGAMGEDSGRSSVSMTSDEVTSRDGGPSKGKGGKVRASIHPEQPMSDSSRDKTSPKRAKSPHNGWMCKLGLCKTCTAENKAGAAAAATAAQEEAKSTEKPIRLTSLTTRSIPSAPSASRGTTRVKVALTVQGGLDLALRRAHHKRMPSHEALLHVAREHSLPPPPLPVPLSSPSKPTEEEVGRLRSAAQAVHGEAWAMRRARLRERSPHGARPGWDVRAVIVKSGDDCRQELLAMQLITALHDVWTEARLPLWLRPYEVLVTSNRTALIEMVPNAPSIHTIKAASPPGSSLRDHFAAKFVEGSPAFTRAQRNFVESMAAYSLVSYFLQLRDRHNGNILLDDAGHVVHIDFGFMLSNSPGGVNFESAPFKLTRELLEVMDSDPEGRPSELFDYFKVLMIQGFLAARRHSDRLCLLVEMMAGSGCPCFKNKVAAVQSVKRRFALGIPEPAAVELMLGLISDSLDAWRTRQYDYYQRVLNGIL